MEPIKTGGLIQANHYSKPRLPQGEIQLGSIVNFPHFHTRTIWWIAGTAMVVLFAIGWFVSRVLLGNHAIVEPSRLGDSEGSVSGQVEDLHRIAQVNTGEENIQAKLHDLLLACSEDTVGISEECMKALDAYLLQKPIPDMLLHWIEFPSALTYASIFEDPIGDRERVFAVLESPECRFEEEKGFRLDLKESCDAAAIARFSKFLKVCRFDGAEPMTLELFFHDYEFQTRDEDWSKLQHNLEVESSGELEVEYLTRRGWESRWKSEKCKVLNDSSLVMIPSRDDQNLARLMEMSRRFGMKSTATPSDKYMWNWTHLRVLESLANRLGAEETFSSTSVPFSPNANAEWDQHVRITRPWLKPWKELVRFPDRRQSTRLGIDLVLGLQDVGAEFDWNYLIHMICSRKTEETSTCQEVFNEVKQSTEWSEVRKLQVLDEFETRALQLGLYD